MPKNGWTKDEVERLLAYQDNEGCVIKCQGETIFLHVAPGTDSLEFGMWCVGEDEWESEYEEDLAWEGSPTFTYEDDKYTQVFYLEDYKKSDITVERVQVTTIDWQKPRNQVRIE